MFKMPLLKFNSDDRSVRQEGDSNALYAGSQTVQNFTGIRLNTFAMTNSLYNVNSQIGNTLSFSVADDANGLNEQTYSITLPPGNYLIGGSGDILATMKTLMDAEITPLTVSWTDSTLTGKLSLSISGGKYIRINASEISLNLPLGFTRRSNSVYGTTITAPRMYDLNRYKTLNLFVDCIGAGSWFSNTNSKTTCIAVLPIGKVGFQKLFSYPDSPNLTQFIKIANSNVGSIRITLRDDSNNIVDLNGLNIVGAFEVI